MRPFTISAACDYTTLLTCMCLVLWEGAVVWMHFRLLIVSSVTCGGLSSHERRNVCVCAVCVCVCSQMFRFAVCLHVHVLMSTQCAVGEAHCLWRRQIEMKELSLWCPPSLLSHSTFPSLHIPMACFTPLPPLPTHIVVLTCISHSTLFFKGKWILWKWLLEHFCHVESPVRFVDGQIFPESKEETLLYKHKHTHTANVYIQHTS